METTINDKGSQYQDDQIKTNIEVVIIGAGCFWCVEAIFQNLKGVLTVTAGYTGGHTKNPTYHEVCSGQTGHAEVARIEFEPKKISLEQILEVFWKTHNPTTLNKQGDDVGTQYRSCIFYHNENQRIIAEKSKKQAGESVLFNDPIVTKITPLGDYYQAEDYHQNYFKSNPNKSYCSLVIKPKVEKFKDLFKDKLKKD